VHFTSSDTQGVLPKDSTLSNGTGTFSVTLKTAGGQGIVATDTVNPNLLGSVPITVNAGPAGTPTIPATTTNPTIPSRVLNTTRFSLISHVPFPFIAADSITSRCLGCFPI